MTYEHALNGMDKIRAVVKYPADVEMSRIPHSSNFLIDVGDKNRAGSFQKILFNEYQIEYYLELLNDTF